MIDHLGLRTKQIDALAKFYESALAPLGWTKIVEYDGAIALGKNGNPVLWLGMSDVAPSSIHLAFTSDTRDGVDAFYKAAMSQGGKDNGGPGLRPDYSPTYYAAFVIDPDGNNVEAVCHKG